MESIGDFEYNKRDLIGHGAFAVVFKGRHKVTHDPVAIKSITKKNLAKSQNLLSKEIKILKELSDLHHENVVALLDCKETTHHVYLVMEYCNGGDLADYLQAKGTLSEDTISGFLRQIAGAMRALNGKGIVHRDLKPQNILLTHSGQSPNPQPSDLQLKIADFGFARFLNDGVMAATLCGSPMYMAPEVIMSVQYDAKADLWSIGTIVFQCLTGKAPFQAQTPQQLKAFYEKNANLAPNIPSGTSKELRDLLMKLLKRNAKDRIDFDEFFSHPFVCPAKASSPVPVPQQRARHPSDSPTLKTVSSSPLSGNVPYSPVNTDVQRVQKQEDVSESPQEGADFVKVDSKSGSPAEDFVLVPNNLGGESEGSASSGRSKESPKHGRKDSQPSAQRVVRVDTTTEAASFRKGNAGSPSPQDQTSPTRPTSLPVIKQTSPPSQPIPVPTQVEAYQRIQKNSPSSPKEPRTKEAGTHVMSPQRELASQAVPIPRIASDRMVSVGSFPDIRSVSPPSVQFHIGTPPSKNIRRNSIEVSPGRPNTATPPNGSPLRKSGAQSNSSPFSGPASLPKPSVMSVAQRFTVTNYPAGGRDVVALARTRTVPEGVQAMTTVAGAAYDPYATWPRRLDTTGLAPSQTEPSNLQRTTSGGHLAPTRIGEQLMKAAFGQTTRGLSNQIPSANSVVPYRERNQSESGQRERRDSFQKRDSFTRERQDSTGRERSGSSPPNSLPYAQSPPNMEGPILFEAPELAEETLMDSEHNETVAKLTFVLALVETIIELAQKRSTPLTQSISPQGRRDGGSEQVKFLSESQRRMEQLVLHVKALQLLSASLQLAKEEIKAGKLMPSNTVKNILKEMNNHYHRCMGISKQLKSCNINDNELKSFSTTADKLIYNYAIEMCQTAALDELFGNPQECFRMYKNAQILLHALAHQAQHNKDKDMLNKYKEAVEKRLFSLQSQGLNYFQYEN
ncbi:serine/threonine-protein kinase ULK2 isoform X2 [Lingula anatina]|uniref:Serine/threonine-protein kinase ULK2 isoform X2 n=1 Tax=Lingula anatina TaxID=7574 RepID=A0A1S3HDQ8_LINAN|nr:serine/threonine-protein kinase ULK2 isoform X2 [Lingula anatina]|eukprot:XP_013383229.1 serine/threonine-protein kinase ULK2 isoform X2 [Lingula anatina]